MIDDVYEVTREDYTNFLSQIKAACKDTKIVGKEGPYTEINTFSVDGARHFATRTITSIKNEDRSEEKYYIIDMPLTEESLPPKVIRKITLETKEEVQTFLDILAKIQRGEIK